MPERDGSPGSCDTSRRSFLRTAATATAGAVLAPKLAAGHVGDAPKGSGLKIGCAAITWREQDEQAIDDIASLGFRGIQLRTSVLTKYEDRADDLRRRLEGKGLSLLCFSSGSVDADPAREREYLETHERHARFVKSAGGGFLQLTSRRPKDRAPTPEEFERLGRLLTRIGRRASDAGVRAVYHNHMNAFGEAPDEVARVLDASDAKFVSLLLDIAHYAQGGGDPVAAVARHRDRLAVLHLKDVIGPLPGDTRPTRLSYKFVELGRGRVDVPGVIAALRNVSFHGPSIVELDAVPDPPHTAKECAADNKRYLVETLGLSL